MYSKLKVICVLFMLFYRSCRLERSINIVVECIYVFLILTLGAIVYDIQYYIL